MAHAHDGRRDFRRADRVAIQGRLSSSRHRRPADTFVRIISPINDSATPFSVTLASATQRIEGAFSSWICVRFNRPMNARLSDYDYVLPRELIAQRPLERRQDSRMMVLHRAEQKIEHRQFGDLKTFLEPGDLLVLNDTRVVAARRFSDNGAVEFLFLERVGAARWKCMVTPGRKMRIGATATIDNVSLRVEEITAEGERIVAFEKGVDVYAGGSMPLPPYVSRFSDDTDAARYQTVFAREPGAVAAPTAGLHFTSGILSEIPHAFLTLHVGPGTFLPVRSE